MVLKYASTSYVGLVILPVFCRGKKARFKAAVQCGVGIQALCIQSSSKTRCFPIRIGKLKIKHQIAVLGRQGIIRQSICFESVVQYGYTLPSQHPRGGLKLSVQDQPTGVHLGRY